MRYTTNIAVLALCGSLAACATYPTGPSMMALPGNGVSFDQFRADDYQCQSYAQQSIGLQSPQQSASNSGVNSAAVGTAVGAAAGALLGAASGNAGAGAAIGAGSGLILGSAAGTDAYASSGYMAQQRYDDAYIQCMYAKGHQVPVPASVANYQQPAPSYIAPPPTGPVAVPPSTGSYPPPGTPPPPGY
jgi:hypothetical protein